jgi:hypothetical protein
MPADAPEPYKRDYRLPSAFFTLRVSTSISSKHRTLIAAIFAPIFGYMSSLANFNSFKLAS